MFNQKTIDDLTDRLNEAGNENLKLKKDVDAWGHGFSNLLINLYLLYKINFELSDAWYFINPLMRLETLNERLQNKLKEKSEKDKITEIVKEILDKKESE